MVISYIIFQILIKHTHFQAALMRLLPSFCFLNLFSIILSSVPDVFEDYFNEDVQVSCQGFRVKDLELMMNRMWQSQRILP